LKYSANQQTNAGQNITLPTCGRYNKREHFAVFHRETIWQTGENDSCGQQAMHASRPGLTTPMQQLCTSDADVTVNGLMNAENAGKLQHH